MTVIPYADQDRAIETGQIDAAFSCGITYVLMSAQVSSPVRLIAAPVMPAARYQNQPVYFSDIIVRAASSYHTLDDLRGATLAYNDTGSLSGFVALNYHLYTLGETMESFFGKAITSGSHARSMDWVEAGDADCAAIDSVVLDMELAQRPERAAAFRLVTSLGPSAMPPVIATPSLSEEARTRLARALVELHTTEHGRSMLNFGGVRRFAPVEDADYDGIRKILKDLTFRQTAFAQIP
jgi:phosphonate transport system substrate-binding protein